MSHSSPAPPNGTIHYGSMHYISMYAYTNILLQLSNRKQKTCISLMPSPWPKKVLFGCFPLIFAPNSLIRQRRRHPLGNWFRGNHKINRQRQRRFSPLPWAAPPPHRSTSTSPRISLLLPRKRIYLMHNVCLCPLFLLCPLRPNKALLPWFLPENLV